MNPNPTEKSLYDEDVRIGSGDGDDEDEDEAGEEAEQQELAEVGA